MGCDWKKHTGCFLYANTDRKEAEISIQVPNLHSARERAEKEITSVIKRNFRYIALALTLAAFTSTVQNASAQSSGCSDPNSCVVGGSDPQPMSIYQTILIVLATTVVP